MMDILPAPDHVGAYRLNGIVSEQDFDRIAQDIEQRLGRHKKIGVLVDLTGFEDVTVKAGLKDLRFGFGKILQWKRFAREAIITDRRWLHSLASVSDKIVPFVDVRAFMPGERDAALHWVADSILADA